MTYRLPTLNGLRAFEASARHLSFKIAASELGVTPGAVSQQVKKLEASLGIALFRRLPHGLLLTREGEAYYPEIARVFDLLTAATEAVAPDINAKKFTLGVGAQVIDLLPDRWPRHTPALDGFVRDICVTDDLALIFENKLDAILRRTNGPAGNSPGNPVGGLSAKIIPYQCEEDGSGHVQYICRNGLINCRQSKAILEELERCLG
ncbi:MAG: LysR family transcriptional regulator [Pseudomonadota bacterium]